MDIWGVGCVFFEMLSLFPLFPGNNEKDQIHKIHNILGTPPREMLDRFRKYASHIDFNFPHITGTGINKLIPHIAPECQDFIAKLLTYNPDERPTCRQALNSPYFKDIRSQDIKVSFHKELGGVSPTNAGEEHSVDAQDPYQPKRGIKPGETMADPAVGHKKKVQQGARKWGGGEYEPDQNNDYEDFAVTNNLPPIRAFGMMQDIKKKKNYNPTDLKHILKQTFSNNNVPNCKKGWVPPAGATKKIMEHKKHYISPYSQKAILQQKPIG